MTDTMHETDLGTPFDAEQSATPGTPEKPHKHYGRVIGVVCLVAALGSAAAFEFNRANHYKKVAQADEVANITRGLKLSGMPDVKVYEVGSTWKAHLTDPGLSAQCRNAAEFTIHNAFSMHPSLIGGTTFDGSHAIDQTLSANSSTSYQNMITTLETTKDSVCYDAAAV